MVASALNSLFSAADLGGDFYQFAPNATFPTLPNLDPAMIQLLSQTVFPSQSYNSLLQPGQALPSVPNQYGAWQAPNAPVGGAGQMPSWLLNAGSSINAPTVPNQLSPVATQPLPFDFSGLSLNQLPGMSSGQPNMPQSGYLAPRQETHERRLDPSMMFTPQVNPVTGRRMQELSPAQQVLRLGSMQPGAPANMPPPNALAGAIPEGYGELKQIQPTPDQLRQAQSRIEAMPQPGMPTAAPPAVPSQIPQLPIQKTLTQSNLANTGNLFGQVSALPGQAPGQVGASPTPQYAAPLNNLMSDSYNRPGAQSIQTPNLAGMSGSVPTYAAPLNNLMSDSYNRPGAQNIQVPQPLGATANRSVNAPQLSSMMGAMASQMPQGQFNYAAPKPSGALAPLASSSRSYSPITAQTQLPGGQSSLQGLMRQTAPQLGTPQQAQDLQSQLTGAFTGNQQLPFMQPMMDEIQRRQAQERSSLEERLALRGLSNSTQYDRAMADLSRQQNNELLLGPTQALATMAPQIAGLASDISGQNLAQRAQGAGEILGSTGLYGQLSGQRFGELLGSRQQGVNELLSSLGLQEGLTQGNYNRTAGANAQNFSQQLAAQGQAANQGLTATALQNQLLDSLFGRQLGARQQGMAEAGQTFGQNLQGRQQGVNELLAGAGLQDQLMNSLFNRQLGGRQQGMAEAGQTFSQNLQGRQQGVNELLAGAGLQDQLVNSLFNRQLTGQGQNFAQQLALNAQGQNNAVQTAQLIEALTQGQFGRDVTGRQQSAAEQQQLWNQGFMGSQANAQNMLQSLGLGETLNQGAFGRQLAAQELGAALQNQRFGQGMTTANFDLNRLMGLTGMGESLNQGAFNRALAGQQQGYAQGNQLFGQQLAANQAGVQNILNALQAREGLTQGAFNRGATAATLGGQLGQQDFAQQLARRQQDISEFMQLFGVQNTLDQQQQAQQTQALALLLNALGQQTTLPQAPNITLPNANPGVGAALGNIGGNALTALLSNPNFKFG